MNEIRLGSISPKMVRLLTVAIMRNARKYYPDAGAVGVYPFEGKHYSNKRELKEAVLDWCAKLTYEQIPMVRRNFGLL